MIFILCLTFSYYSKTVIIKKEIRKGRDSYSEISLRWTGVPWTTNITYLPCIIPLDSLYLWKVMYRSNRSFNIRPPRGTPRAFDIFVVSGRREFYYQSLPGGGEFDPHTKGMGNLNRSLHFMWNLWALCTWRAIMAGTRCATNVDCRPTDWQVNEVKIVVKCSNRFRIPKLDF